jgi:uncharacterized repeat protein (TIGR02543 family)
MAAPNGTIWGSIVDGSSSGRKGRIGIYTSVSNTNTQTTVNVQVWFWTIYSCADGYNNFYYDVGTSISSATTLIGAIDITHTVATGEGWNTANQTRLINKTYTYNRGTSDVTYRVYAKYNGIDMIPSGTMYANTSYTVPKLASYTVSYNANGGSGAPSSQTKWYGQNLTIHSTIPYRTGYTFKGWALTKADADAGTWYYTAGSSCGKNENLTLYAVWEAVTYSITFNANGGSGAPGNQLKTHGVTLTLSSVIPTRPNHTFIGWAKSSVASTKQYDAGGLFTDNVNTTLYAVWALSYTKPRISNIDVSRCDGNGNNTDSGTYARVMFNWACDHNVTSIVVRCTASDGENTTHSLSGSGSTGSINTIIGGSLNNELTYTVQITVADQNGESSIFRTLSGIKFAIDVKQNVSGIAFGKPAELDGVLDINFLTMLRGGLKFIELAPNTNMNDVLTPNFYAGFDIASNNYDNCPLSDGSFTMIVSSAGGHGQVRQYIEECDKRIPEKFERYYYASSGWGDWIKMSPTNLRQILYHTQAAANATELVGSITIPAYKFYTITARGMFNNASCKSVIIGTSNSDPKQSLAAASYSDPPVHYPSCTFSGYTGTTQQVLYIWGCWAGANQNTVEINGFYLPY